MSVLRLSNIEVSYRDMPVLWDLNFTLERGEILAVVGESGSGKSTLLKTVLGLLGKDGSVTAGQIFLEEKDMAKMSKEELRQIRGQKIGMIFQDSAAFLCPTRRIKSQLYETAAAHGKLKKRKVRTSALELLKKMKSQEGERILKSYPFELSGGMSQRVGIMMAMILNPILLLADEPTSALDVTAQAQVMQEMLRLRKDFQTSIVLVTHNIILAKKMADKIAVLHRGRIIEYGSKAEIIYKPRQVYTKKLLESVLQINR